MQLQRAQPTPGFLFLPFPKKRNAKLKGTGCRMLGIRDLAGYRKPGLCSWPVLTGNGQLAENQVPEGSPDSKQILVDYTG